MIYRVSFDDVAADDAVLEWTTKPPTQVGDYFAWKKDDEYFFEPTIVNVTNIRHISEPPFYTFWFGGIEYELDSITHWLGPLPVPEPPTEESENA
jgi:hypothetical protein